MSLFRRDGGTPEPLTKADRSATEGTAALAAGSAGHVAAGSRVEGKVGGSADWVIDGELVGSLQIDGRVTVGAGGRVEGTIGARGIRIAGRVEGDVTAAERVEVVASGHLEGNIAAPRVIIAEGAFFKGSVAMAGSDAKSGAKERKS